MQMQMDVLFLSCLIKVAYYTIFFYIFFFFPHVSNLLEVSVCWRVCLHHVCEPYRIYPMPPVLS